jgi:chaperonin GroES
MERDCGRVTLLDTLRLSPYVRACLWHSAVVSANRASIHLLDHLSAARRHPTASIDQEEDMAKMNFRPLHDRVVVQRIDAEAKTKGGIIIPDTAKEKPQEGKIVAVGPGGRDEAGKLIKPDVKVGDRVLFGKWSGTEVKIEGEDLLIMKDSDIMGVIG